ncbi:MAG: hypothetical protein IT464_08965 [Planctomycetes bacterium]|nr:hypothetical protein [Planctomycetota bacterium]
MSNPELEDHVRARILEADFALEPVHGFLELEIKDLLPGVRTQAEAFLANAPSLYGYERDTERIYMTLDIAVSAMQADATFGGGYALAAACIYRLGVQDSDLFDTRALTAAIPWAFRAVTVDPEWQDGWEVYVQLHCYKGDFGTAEKALGEIFKRFGDNDLYARCAFLYFRLKGDAAQAINWGALAWQTEWDTHRLVQTLFALGLLYRDMNLWPKALDAYRVITERDHENAWAFHYSSICAAELGDFTHALELNEKAVHYGQLHEFRAYREDLKKLAGRARLGRGRITTSPVGKPKVVAAPPAVGKVVAAPPPATGKLVAAPPPAKSTRVVAAPPPVANKPAGSDDPTRMVKKLPPKPSTNIVPPPPPAKPPVRPPTRKPKR